MDVYDNSTGTLKKFAVIKGGYRYPITGDYGSWWKVNVGGREGYSSKSSTVLDKGITVFMYHHILTAEEKAKSPFANRNTTMIDTQFNEQMDYLKEHGFKTISIKDLEDYLDGKINLPAKVAVITLDAGNISSRIYAYPTLKAHGFVADQFIITSRTPKQPAIFDYNKLHFLSQQEMDDMTDVFNYYGHTHALHTLTDANESYVTAMDRSYVKEDLLLNRLNLKEMTYLAYPFGQYNMDTVEILKETGFTMAYTTKMGYVTLDTNRYLIPRYGIEPHLPIETFAKRLATGSSLLDNPSHQPDDEVEKTNNFTDVKKDEFFYESVKRLTERGIIQGYADGTFKPYTNVTRGQAAKILAKTLNLTTDKTSQSPFVDVPETNEYYPSITALVDAGIIQGYSDDTFRPGNTLTRAQMAKMIALGFKLKESTLDLPFVDVQVEDEFAKYVQALLTDGITTGTTATTFSPYHTVTRGQLAAFVDRAENAK